MAFGPEASQDDLFRDCGVVGLLDSVRAGYSCTVLAYGQTGSGKTHTMTGPPDRGRAARKDGCKGLQ